jgi:hypothetical protein
VNAAALLVIAALAAPAPGPLSIDVAANRSSVQSGDTVRLTVVVRDDEDPSIAPAKVRIDQRLPSSLRYVSGTGGAVVSNTLVQWVVPIEPAHSGSVSATYTVTSDPPSGEMKLSTMACLVEQDGEDAAQGDGGAASPCQTTSLEITDAVASTQRASLLGRGVGWSAVLIVGAGVAAWAWGRRRHLRKSLLRRTDPHD